MSHYNFPIPCHQTARHRKKRAKQRCSYLMAYEKFLDGHRVDFSNQLSTPHKPCNPVHIVFVREQSLSTWRTDSGARLHLWHREDATMLIAMLIGERSIVSHQPKKNPNPPRSIPRPNRFPERFMQIPGLVREKCISGSSRVLT
ncbi:hypothetical protein CRG98_032878 [Punica granatum]|uniref:Uncharacterized protein n=1 Tax=Punica granatum TaxID=22663 RepID=A0A2I0IRW1_PUNGR|nr:hypothetical protein CRG98_032878 [Punica granatum]